MPRAKPSRYRLRGGNPGNCSYWAIKVMVAVACPRCKMAAGWQCMTANEKWSSTAHADRITAYHHLTAGQT